MKTSKTNTQVLFLHNINIPKYKTKLQMTYWITQKIYKKITILKINFIIYY